MTENDRHLHGHFLNVAEDMVGASKILEMKPVMGSEDFSFYSELIPGYFYYVGMKNETLGISEPGHSPHFRVNEGALSYGAALQASLATRYILEHHHHMDDDATGRVPHDEL